MLDASANYWLPVDHMLRHRTRRAAFIVCARFFHKLMRDEGLLNSDEPFTRLLSQGRY